MSDSTSVTSIDENASTLKLTKQKEKGPAVVTVVLKPHKSHFHARTLELKEKSRIKIGRQTSTKTAPTAFNGYFDSKVLSRQHAEILYDKHRVYIKDVKSSNGTFVNGNRLSNEGEESIPCEIKSNDELEFGIDIINDDGTEVMYQKVSCLVQIYPVPISQIDENILKEENQTAPLTQLSRSSSVNTLSNNFESQKSENKPNHILEALVLQLQNEIDTSKTFYDELTNIKNSVNDLDRTVNQDNKHNELQERLKEAEVTILAFDEKWRFQKQAIDTAKNELHSLEKQTVNFDKLSNELKEEMIKSKALEQQLKIKAYNEPVEASSKNMVSMFISGILISILVYYLWL